MKTIKFLFSLLLIAFLSACSDEAVDPALLNQSNNNNNNNNNGNNGNTAGVLTAKIDSVDFSSVSNSGTYTSVGTNTQLFLSGNTSDGKTITISITNPAVGTVSASLSGCVLAYASQGSVFTSTNPATSTSVGTVTLTSFDTVNNRVTGTFSFTGYNNDGTITRQIANGSINSFPFTNSVTSGGNNSGNGIIGTYKITDYITDTATDLDGDGTSHVNQMLETSCLNNTYLYINSDHTFTANSKGVELLSNSLSCYTDSDYSGTWSLIGNTLTLSYTDAGSVIQDDLLVSSNILERLEIKSYIVRNGSTYSLESGIVTTRYTKQ